MRTKTVVELEDSETFMIGGLLQQKITIDERGVPFLRRMPLIGKLFDNTNNSYADSELLVVVTPVIVNPTKEPLSDDPDSDGLIEQASKMHPYRVKDPNMEALDKYLKENRKSLQEQIKAFQENQPAKNSLAEVKAVKVTTKENTAPLEASTASAGKTPVKTASSKAEAPIKAQTANTDTPVNVPPPAVIVKSAAEVKPVLPAPAAVPAQPKAAVPASTEKKISESPAPVMTASSPKSLDALEEELKWQNASSAGKSGAVPAASETDKKAAPAVQAADAGGKKS